MRQVIPFKKDIVFKTKLEEITSISLEHNLKLGSDNFITGEFIISGDYKISSNSNRLELFNYELPFDIALDNSYSIDETSVDIEDFYYEIINDDTLRVNIEVSIEGEVIENKPIEDAILNEVPKEVETLETEEEPKEEVFRFSSEDDNKKNDTREDAIIEKVQEKTVTQNVKEEEVDDNVKTLFSAINSEEEETFVTYHVHIVRENEDIDSILKKYNITKEEFLNYNTMEEISLGNKLIIPATSNE